MAGIRKPLQGTRNILQFNWHFYLFAAGLILALLLLLLYTAIALHFYLYLVCLLIASTTLLSLLVSFYIYDLSALYKLTWLNNIKADERSLLINVHAGFDETSALLKEKYSDAALAVLDFYDPVTMTEVSIKRARKAYPPHPNSIPVTATAMPLADSSADAIFVIFSAHEIRDEVERTAFFRELSRILKPTGTIVVTEHLRDAVNFCAYNIGFLHFYSKTSWLRVFQTAALSVQQETKLTPFVSSFTLMKNGASS